MPLLLRSRNRGITPGSSEGGIIALADFLNGEYSVGETNLTAADVVDNTGRIGSDGLSIEGSEVNFIGDFADLLLTANWTVVAEMDLSASGGVNHKVFPVNLFSVAGNEVYGYAVTPGSGMGWEPEFNDISEPESFAERLITHSGSTIAVGIFRCAYTRTDSGAAMSVNGGAADVDATSLEMGATTSAYTGVHTSSGAVSVSGHVRRIEIYDPVDAADLPALSALS